MTDVYASFQQGRDLLAKGRLADAAAALERARDGEPEKASIRESLGIAYFRQRRWRDAEAEFRKMLELAPADDYAHYALGRALEKLGKDAEANGHYKLAKSLRPESRRYASRIRDLSDDADSARSSSHSRNGV